MGNFRYPSEGSNDQFGAFATGFILLYFLLCSARYRQRVTEVVAQLDRGAERRSFPSSPAMACSFASSPFSKQHVTVTFALHSMMLTVVR